MNRPFSESLCRLKPLNEPTQPGFLFFDHKSLLTVPHIGRQYSGSKMHRDEEQAKLVCFITKMFIQ